MKVRSERSGGQPITLVRAFANCPMDRKMSRAAVCVDDRGLESCSRYGKFPQHLESVIFYNLNLIVKFHFYLCSGEQSFVVHVECSSRIVVHFEPRVCRGYFGQVALAVYARQPKNRGEGFSLVFGNQNLPDD